MPDNSETTLLSKSLLDYVEPQSTAGINAAVIYGTVVTGVVGASTSLVLGSNTAICINPVTPILDGIPVPPALQGFAKGGAGGNFSFVIGTNATMNMGPVYEVNWGEKYEFHLGELGKQNEVDPLKYSNPAKIVSLSFCTIISGFVTAFFFAYGYTKDQNKRANILVSWQAILNILLSVLVGIDVQFHEMGQKTEDGVKIILDFWKKHPYLGAGLTFVSALPSITAAVIAPSIATAEAEKHFPVT